MRLTNGLLRVAMAKIQIQGIGSLIINLEEWKGAKGDGIVRRTELGEFPALSSRANEAPRERGKNVNALPGQFILEWNRYLDALGCWTSKQIRTHEAERGEKPATNYRYTWTKLWPTLSPNLLISPTLPLWSTLATIEYCHDRENGKSFTDTTLTPVEAPWPESSGTDFEIVSFPISGPFLYTNMPPYEYVLPTVYSFPVRRSVDRNRWIQSFPPIGKIFSS